MKKDSYSTTRIQSKVRGFFMAQLFLKPLSWGPSWGPFARWCFEENLEETCVFSILLRVMILFFWQIVSLGLKPPPSKTNDEMNWKHERFGRWFVICHVLSSCWNFRVPRIGLWDPFQMAFFWTINGGDPNHLQVLGWSSKYFYTRKCIHKKGCTWLKKHQFRAQKSINKTHPDLVVLQTNNQEPHQKQA